MDYARTCASVRGTHDLRVKRARGRKRGVFSDGMPGGKGGGVANPWSLLGHGI